MATNLPEKIDEFLAWADNHQGLWTSSPENIGLTAAEALEFKTMANDLQTLRSAAIAAREASRGATLDQNEGLRDTRRKAGELVNTIKAFAERTGNSEVYALAGVSPDAPRGQAPDPTPPFDFVATIDSFGDLTLSWKSRQPAGVSGTTFQVSRQMNGTGAWEILDTVGLREFVDETIPQGTNSVAYIVRAKRSNRQSVPSAAYHVLFGHAQSGQLFIAQAA
ncbi:MAG: fibronectin type III domain-containing protein [Phycisphaerales bacterium]|nr:MAG: fibronectin type III domain-containing protein [Phycisphaerales bacterium]